MTYDFLRTLANKFDKYSNPEYSKSFVSRYVRERRRVRGIRELRDELRGSGGSVVESFAASDESHDKTLFQRGCSDVRGKASRTMVVRLSSAGFPLRDANLVDDRGEHRVRQVRGGLRQFVERLSEETNLTIEYTDHVADRRADETGEAKGDDHLHH